MKSITTTLFLFLSLLAYAQPCETPESSSDFWSCGVESIESDSVNYSASIDPEYLASFEPVVFNIFFWSINESDGTGQTFNEEQVLKAIWELNRAFNQFNIFFKLKGYDNTSWNDCTYRDNRTLSEISWEAFQLGYREDNSFNVYVPYTLASGGGAAWYFNTLIGINVNSFQNHLSTLVHEVGHCFNLYHNPGKEGKGDYDTPEAEHVTRDLNDPLFNANTHGDEVVDTPAQPFFHDGINDVNNSCFYTGLGQNWHDEFYEIDVEDVENYLANGAYSYSLLGCRNKFTIGQGIRMRETIEYTGWPHIGNAETTVDALFEPYRGQYYVYGPIDPSVDYQVLFQPGFDYEFRLCSCDNQDSLDCSEPCDFSNTSFQNNHTLISSWDKDDFHHYPLITHPNHTSIIIGQLSQYGPRKCWDNWNKASIGGALTTFNDGVINSNVTIQPQDSLQINDENLINNLPSGLYKLDENYNDGTTRQRVISKENE